MSASMWRVEVYAVPHDFAIEGSATDLPSPCYRRLVAAFHARHALELAAFRVQAPPGRRWVYLASPVEVLDRQELPDTRKKLPDSSPAS